MAPEPEIVGGIFKMNYYSKKIDIFKITNDDFVISYYGLNKHFKTRVDAIRYIRNEIKALQKAIEKFKTKK